MKSNQTFSILIWAHKTRQTPQGLPLYARITVNGKRAVLSLKRKVDPDLWDPVNSKVTGSSLVAKNLNKHIQGVKTELYRIYDQMYYANEFITAEGIKRRYLGEESPRKTILQTIRAHVEDIERKLGTDFAHNTHVKYKTLENKIMCFVKDYRRKSDIFLEQLDYKFVTEFEYYLRSVDKLNSNSTMKYIRMLKTVMNEAVRKEWLDKNPFQGFKCTFKWPEKEVLTMDELQQIIDKEFPMDRLNQVKDYFVFACYTGLAYADVVRLTPDDISIGIDGGQWLIINRTKTQTLSRVPLLPQALAIIDKYKDHPKAQNKGTLFPGISNQKLNSYLKEIGDICGIKKNITFHLARHTFATTVTLANGVPIESVSKMLGHTNITTTQVYAKVVEQKLSQDMQMLNQKLSKQSNKLSKAK